MSRVQLALNVADLDEAVTFYSRLFAAKPAKVRPGYANFVIAETSDTAWRATGPELSGVAPPTPGAAACSSDAS